MLIFPSIINGTPCRIKVIEYTPAQEGKYGARPEDCYPAEEEELEFTILDENDNPAPWLEKKVTAADEEQVRKDYHKQLMQGIHL